MHEIIICSNDETICDGHSNEDTAAWNVEIAAAYTDAAAQVICDAAQGGQGPMVVDYNIDRFYANWHGGKHAKAGAVIGGKNYGYKIGWVVCHSVNPPQWAKDLIDKAAQAGADARDVVIAEYKTLVSSA